MHAPCSKHPLLELSGTVLADINGLRWSDGKMKQEAAVEPNDKFLDDIARDDVLLVGSVEAPGVER